MGMNKWILLVICICIGISHVIYVNQSRQYPQWDEHSYLSLTMRNYDIFRNKGFLGLPEIIVSNTNRQPVYPLILSSIILLTGTAYSYKIALLFNGVFYIASIVGTYYLSKEFFDKKTSILGAILFATLGNALFYSHFTYTETPLTTFVIWSLLFMKRKKDVLGITLFAVATLTRFLAPIFLIGMLFVEGISALKKRRYRFFISLFFIGMVIPVIFYFFPNWGAFREYIQNNQGLGAQWVAQYRLPEMANTFSTRSIMYYFNILSQNTIFIFAAFAIGFLYCVFHIKKTLSLLLSFILPYAFLTFIVIWKEDRFLVPLYPVFAIITAASILWFKEGMVKTFFTTFLVVISLLNFLGAVWGIGPMGKKGLTDIVLPSFIHHPRRIYLTPLVWTPNKEYINAHQLFEIIGDKRGEEILQLFEYEPWDTAVYSILSYEKRGWFTIRREKVVDEKATYILTKNVTLAENQIGSIYLPIDGSIVYVYKR